MSTESSSNSSMHKAAHQLIWLGGLTLIILVTLSRRTTNVDDVYDTAQITNSDSFGATLNYSLLTYMIAMLTYCTSSNHQITNLLRASVLLSQIDLNSAAASLEKDQPVITLPEFRINMITEGSQSRPAAAILPDGIAWIAWQGHQEGHFRIYANRYSANGIALGNEFGISASGINAQVPDVAVTSTGEAWIVWQAGGPGSEDIYCQRFSKDGAPIGVQFTVNTLRTGGQSLPKISISPTNNVWIIWQHYNNGNSGIYGQRYFLDGNPNGSEIRVTSSNSISQRPQSPSLCFVTNNQLWIAWGQSGSILAKRFTANGSALDADNVLISQNNMETNIRPNIVASIGMMAWIVWQQGDRYNTVARRYSVTGTSLTSLSSEIPIYSHSEKYCCPQIATAISPSNETWILSEFKDTDNNIALNRYTLDGMALGEALTVNTNRTDDQEFPEIAFSSDSKAWLLWEGKQTGSFEIYAMQYSLLSATTQMTSTPLMSSSSTSASAVAQVQTTSELAFSEVSVSQTMKQTSALGTLTMTKQTKPVESPSSAPHYTTAVSVGSSTSKTKAPLSSEEHDDTATIVGASIAGGFGLSVCLGLVGFFKCVKKPGSSEPPVALAEPKENASAHHYTVLKGISAQQNQTGSEDNSHYADVTKLMAQPGSHYLSDEEAREVLDAGAQYASMSEARSLGNS